MRRETRREARRARMKRHQKTMRKMERLRIRIRMKKKKMMIMITIMIVMGMMTMAATVVKVGAGVRLLQGQRRHTSLRHRDHTPEMRRAIAVIIRLRHSDNHLGENAIAGELEILTTVDPLRRFYFSYESHL
jgi:flagellar basal body-associated protein FliL